MKKVERRRDNKLYPWTMVSVEIFVLLLVFIVAFLTIFVLARKVIFGETENFDMSAFQYLMPYISERNTSIISAVTFLGSQWVLVPGFLLLFYIYFFLKKDKWMGIKVSAISITSLLVMFALKSIFMRPRPLSPLLVNVPGHSFPSGHAFMSFAFFGMLIYIIHRECANFWLKLSLIVLCLCLTFLVGLSRVYLRVHYASDVIAGFCMGYIWVVGSLFVLRYLEDRKLKNIKY